MISIVSILSTEFEDGLAARDGDEEDDAEGEPPAPPAPENVDIMRGRNFMASSMMVARLPPPPPPLCLYEAGTWKVSRARPISSWVYSLK